MRSLGRVVTLVALTAVGFVTGIVGSFIHAYAVELLGISVPIGLLIALLPAVASYLLAGWLLRNRLAVLAPGAGWLVPVLIFSAPRGAGDLVVAADAAGYVFLLGGSALIGLGVALPYGSRGAPLHPVP